MIKLSYKPLWASLLCLLLANNIGAATVEGVRLWRAPDHTRVVLDMSSDATHKLFQLEKPTRLVVDISNTDNKAVFTQLNVKDTPIKRIRTAIRHKKDLRLVFDLKTSIQPRSFFLAANKSKPHRLVIDLYDKKMQTSKTVKKIAQLKHQKPGDKKHGSKAQANTRRDLIIVVDAGHGGEDPGAIGPRRIQEKVVVLDIAKKLARLINKTPGYQAILTRKGDYFIPLHKRRNIAREKRADLFVSIHADAFKSPLAKGASVYALSQRGATSETARFLAKRENETDLIGGVGDVRLTDKDKVLRSVLVDLSMTATVGASLDVGKDVLKGMGGIAHLHKHQVEQAGFAVLKSPDVPSILVETGFISNPGEEKFLSSSRYRQKMASAIFSGVKKYFNRKQPAGTYIAWKQRGGGIINHKVVSGDNLSSLAQRYGTSVKELKRLNKLSGNSIRIGQRLKIAVDSRVQKKAPRRKAVVHKVKSGETLSGIAIRYNTSITAIRKINRLASSSIKIGQTLQIPNESS